MSTRSRIGIKCDDGKVVSVYCHSDGYPTYNGDMLLKHYGNREKVELLISLGDLSFLCENLIQPLGEKHSFDNPYPNVVIAYMRDRGEKDCDPRVDKSEKDFWESDIEEWGYLFKDGKWYFTTSHGTYDEKGGYKEVKPEDRKVYELTEENIKKHAND